MGNIVLKAKIILEPKPNTRTVFQCSGQCGGKCIEDECIPFMKAKGDRDILCGSCGRILLGDILDGQVTNVVIKCPKCGNFNEVM